MDDELPPQMGLAEISQMIIGTQSVFFGALLDCLVSAGLTTRSDFADRLEAAASQPGMAGSVRMNLGTWAKVLRSTDGPMPPALRLVHDADTD